MGKQLNKAIIHKIMDRAIEINQLCKDQCRDFRIMESPDRPNVWILRWLTIDIGNIDNPIQCYHYECFEYDGTPQNCSIYYHNQEEANHFFFNLKTVHKQLFSIDHKIKQYV